MDWLKRYPGRGYRSDRYPVKFEKPDIAIGR